MKSSFLAIAACSTLLGACEVTVRDNATSPDPTSVAPTNTPTAVTTTAPTTTAVATVTPTVAPTATPTAAPTIAPENPNQAIAMNVVGTWSSASCGNRKYERVISFDEKGKFVAEDRVSPCPKDKVCVWSGIAISKGKFTVEKPKVNLTVEDQGKGGQPLPASFSWEKGAIKEEPFCLYSKK
jgi:hypothetical protein